MVKENTLMEKGNGKEAIYEEGTRNKIENRNIAFQ